MAIAGEANRWAPRWMKAIHERIGLSESEPEEGEARELVGVSGT